MTTKQHGLAALDIDHVARWLRVDEAAALARVTSRTIRRWNSIGLLRSSKPAGGRVLIDRESLRALVENAAA